MRRNSDTAARAPAPSRRPVRFDGLGGLVGRVVLIGLIVSVSALLFSDGFW